MLKKKIISVIAIISVTLSLLPAMLFAEEDQTQLVAEEQTVNPDEYGASEDSGSLEQVEVEAVDTSVASADSISQDDYPEEEIDDIDCISEPIQEEAESVENEPTETEHIHEYGEGVITKEATCLKKGIKTFTCSCGYSYTEEIPMSEEHTWDEGTVVKEANCGYAGEKEYTCTICGTTKTEEIPITGKHVVKEKYEEIKAATTEEEGEGINTEYCSVCGTVISSRHVIRTKLKPEGVPTCAYDKHVWGVTKTIVAPTTERKGVGLKYCIICGEACGVSLARLKTEDEIKAMETCEHVWGEGYITKKPSCISTGTRGYKCTLCGKFKYEELEMSGEHLNVTLMKVTSTPATCGKDGYVKYVKKCKDCGTIVDTIEKTIPATGEHTWNDGEVTKEADSTNPGVKTYTCTVCGLTKIEEIPMLEEAENTADTEKEETEAQSADEDSMDEKSEDNEDTNEESDSDKEISDENDSEKKDVTDEKNSEDENSKDDSSEEKEDTKETVDQNTCSHEYDEDTYTIVTQPGCEKEGMATITCNKCGYKDERVLPKLEHDYVLNENGTKKICSKCGDEKEVKHVHDYSTETITTPATCTTDGLKTLTCSCGATKTETIKATGHKYEVIETVEPTCTAKGHTTYICTLCNDNKTRYNEIFVAKGHNYVNGVCTRCGKKTTDCDHTWGTPTVTWSDDHKTATATWHCTKNSSHVITETVNTYVFGTYEPKKCNDIANTVYTAVFWKGGEYVESLRVYDGERLEHDYVTIKYVDPSECANTHTILQKCSRCGMVSNTIFIGTEHMYHNGVCIKCGTKKSDAENSTTSSGSTSSETASSKTTVSDTTASDTTKVSTDKTETANSPATTGTTESTSSETKESEDTSKSTADSLKETRTNPFETTESTENTSNETIDEAVDKTNIAEEKSETSSDISSDDSSYSELKDKVSSLEKTVETLKATIEKLTGIIEQLLSKLM